jgi:hypothetical protein
LWDFSTAFGDIKKVLVHMGACVSQEDNSSENGEWYHFGEDAMVESAASLPFCCVDGVVLREDPETILTRLSFCSAYAACYHTERLGERRALRSLLTAP